MTAPAFLSGLLTTARDVSLSPRLWGLHLLKSGGVYLQTQVATWPTGTPAPLCMGSSVGLEVGTALHVGPAAASTLTYTFAGLRLGEGSQHPARGPPSLRIAER